MHFFLREILLQHQLGFQTHCWCWETFKVSLLYYLLARPVLFTQKLSSSWWPAWRFVSLCRMMRNRAKLKSTDWWTLAKTMWLNRLTTSSSPATVLGSTTTGKSWGTKINALLLHTFGFCLFISCGDVMRTEGTNIMLYIHLVLRRLLRLLKKLYKLESFYLV